MVVIEKTPRAGANRMGGNVAKKRVKASNPVDDLDTMLRTAALRRLQGNTTAKPNAKRAKAKSKKR